MYLVAANYDGLTTLKPARWYLTRAYKTIVAMYYQASCASPRVTRTPENEPRRAYSVMLTASLLLGTEQGTCTRG